MPSGSSAESFLLGNLGWVGTSPCPLSAQPVSNRQRGNLAGKQSLAHSDFFYGILLKRELQPYSFLLLIVPWEPGVNRPSLRWVGWSFKESQRFSHPFPHNQLGEGSCPRARTRGVMPGWTVPRHHGAAGEHGPALPPAPWTHGHPWGSPSHATSTSLQHFWRCTGNHSYQGAGE